MNVVNIKYSLVFINKYCKLRSTYLLAYFSRLQVSMAFLLFLWLEEAGPQYSKYVFQ